MCVLISGPGENEGDAGFRHTAGPRSRGGREQPETPLIGLHPPPALPPSAWKEEGWRTVGTEGGRK